MRGRVAEAQAGGWRGPTYDTTTITQREQKIDFLRLSKRLNIWKPRRAKKKKKSSCNLYNRPAATVQQPGHRPSFPRNITKVRDLRGDRKSSVAVALAAMGATAAQGSSGRMPDGVSRLTVSYMGRPMTIVASLLLAFMSNLFELLQLIRRRNIEGDARPTPQEDHKPPVRLDNLADVSRAHRAKPRGVYSCVG